MASPVEEKTLRLIRRLGILRPRDLRAYGIPRTYLQRLERKGLVERVARGLYAAADAAFDPRSTMAEAAKRVPHGVICLLSALRFHELTTQSPHEVWMAIDRKARRPRASGLPIRFVRFSGRALSEGVEGHRVGGVTLRIYGAAKTVADCFKYRHKLGLDIAIEALRDCLRQRKCSRDELWRYAAICRVTTVMKPYLEAAAG